MKCAQPNNLYDFGFNIAARDVWTLFSNLIYEMRSESDASC